MARKRQIDPEFFSDEDMGELTPEGRLFYVGLWCFSEDTGVFEVQFRKLKANIYPYEDIDTAKLYEQILELGKIYQFEKGDKKCAFIRSFHKRQQIQHPSRSYLPLPPEPYKSLIPEKIRVNNKYKCINEGSMSNSVEINEGSHRIELNRVEENGIEENRVDKKGEEDLSKDSVCKNQLITDEEINDFTRLYTKEQIIQHLTNREVGESEIQRVVEHWESIKNEQNVAESMQKVDESDEK